MITRSQLRRVGLKPPAGPDPRISDRIKHGQKGSARLAKTFVASCIKSGVCLPSTEYRFHPARKWRFDIAFPYEKLAIEINGARWIKGGHSSGSGITRDNEKLQAAVMLGWRVMPVAPEDVLSPKFLDKVLAALECK